jgi:hypothetical protein
LPYFKNNKCNNDQFQKRLVIHSRFSKLFDN